MLCVNTRMLSFSKANRIYPRIYKKISKLLVTYGKEIGSRSI